MRLVPPVGFRLGDVAKTEQVGPFTVHHRVTDGTGGPPIVARMAEIQEFCRDLKGAES